MCGYQENIQCEDVRSWPPLVLLLPLLQRRSNNRINVDLLKDQEQELVRKERDRRPQRNRSNHRDREYEVLDCLGRMAVSLDAPSRIFLIRRSNQHPAHSASGIASWRAYCGFEAAVQGGARGNWRHAARACGLRADVVSIYVWNEIGVRAARATIARD